MKLTKKLIMLLFAMSIILSSIQTSNISQAKAKPKALSNNSFAAYSWILLDGMYDGEKITVNKFQVGTEKKNKEKVIIINYTYKKSKKYAYVRLLEGEATSTKYVPIYQMEHDDFPNKHLIIDTTSYEDVIKNSAKIGKTLKIKDVKKLYKKYKKADEYIIIS